MKKARTNGDGIKMKKSRVMRHQNQIQQGGNFQGNPNYQIDHNAGMIFLLIDKSFRNKPKFSFGSFIN